MQRPGKSIGVFSVNDRGTVTVMFAMTSLISLAFVGLAIDFGTALHAKQQLRTAVDQGAIAGASLPATAAQNRINKAQSYFSKNLQSTQMAAVTPTVVADNSDVAVSATWNYPTSILKLFNIDHLRISVTTFARSQVHNGGVACLLALNPNTDNGLHLQGINAVSSPDCWAWINSNHSQAINAVGASQATAQGFCTAGGVLGGEHFAPHPYLGCDPMPDPFSSKIVPASGACTANNLALTNGTHTLNPGTYCGGIELKPQANVTFNPGLYIIDNGPFLIQAQSSAIGDGVAFVFKGTNAGLEIRGGGHASLKAPPSGAANVGDLHGFVFFQDQYTTVAGQEAIVQGGGTLKIDGIAYIPTWRLNISGNGDVNQDAKYFSVIADSFYLEGNGKLYVRSDFTAAGLPDLMPKIKNGPILLN